MDIDFEFLAFLSLGLLLCFAHQAWYKRVLAETLGDWRLAYEILSAQCHAA